MDQLRKEEEGKRKILRKCAGAPVDYGAIGLLAQAGLRDTFYPELPCKANICAGTTTHSNYSKSPPQTVTQNESHD